MKLVPISLLAIATLPLAAQTWDARLEVPYPKGQNLPQTLISGATTSGSLDTGQGAILTLSHRLVRFGPILKLEWNVEASQLKSAGNIQQGTADLGSELKQTGLGAGINAQFWLPFTGLAGELGLIHRFQHYAFQGAGASEGHNLSRTWLRVGARWTLPLPLPVTPYLAASYQEPLSKNRPVQIQSASDIASYLSTQGSGQEFQRMWTFGVGAQF